MKLFRFIRQRLLSKGKFSKYLPYALGETLLVVVGILIALQINNWNETRINSKIELKLLKSCLEGLKEDLADANYNIGQHSQAIENLDRIILNLEGNEAIDLDMFSRSLSQAMTPTYFVYSTSAFETIKSRGVNIISNDSLRNQIIKVYDSRYGFFLKYEELFVRELFTMYREVIPTRFEEGHYYDLSQPVITGELKPLNMNSLRSDHIFKYSPKTLRNQNRILIDFHYASLKTQITDLIKNLEMEIIRLEN